LNDYQFIEGKPPANYSYAFEETLFNQEKHRELQAKNGWNSFHIVANQKVFGSIHFFIENQIAKSPLRAPYGSLEASEKIDESVVQRFISFIVKHFSSTEINELIIKTAPALYNTSLSANLKESFHESGFEIETSDIQSVIAVSDDQLTSRFHYSEKKRLQKCNSRNLVFQKLPMESAGRVYDFITRCRLEKGFSISMTFEQLETAMKLFPENYLFFVVLDGNKVIAASICIRVSETILYDYAHDHDHVYNNLSPVVFLVNGIYNYCQENGVELLDLGTSLSNGKLKVSLFEFKTRLGATVTEKLTYRKQI
jgi:hypothetical protein